jgi:hypothetical protein
MKSNPRMSLCARAGVSTLGRMVNPYRNSVPVTRIATATRQSAIGMATRTTIEWDYEPGDFFRRPADFALSAGQLHIEAGRAVYTLKTPADPVPTALKDLIKKEVAAVFDLQQLVQHRAYKLSTSIVIQHRPGGGRDAFVSVMASVRPVGGLGPPANEATVEEYVRSVALLIAGSPTLAAMLQSYGRAVQDPADELVRSR